MNRFKETLVRRNTGAVVRDVDNRVIDEALIFADQGIGVAFFLFGDEWVIGQEEYRNLIGYEHISKLLQQPGKQVHVCDLTNQSNIENSRRSVQKVITRAVDELVRTQLRIGLHLQLHIKTGECCTYTGRWDWRFAP